jgi:hypothetical protein
VKRGFFGETAKYSGVKVLDVYKIENRVLLDSFQQTAATSEPGKVKGLFCSVPLECLERVVVYGLSAGAVEGTPLEHVFQESWVNVEAGMPSQGPAPSEENDDDPASGGHAQRCVDQASSIPFPRSFSRHSTLEEDRELCNAAATVDGTDSEIRFLALCRVMIGQIFVTSKVYQGFPDVNADAQFDSMYSSVQEEYRLLNPAYVLPEFLVQYRFAGRRTLTSNGPDAPDAAPAAPAAATNVASALAGLECSLLTPELQLPEYLTRDLKAAPHVTTQIIAGAKSSGRSSIGRGRGANPAPGPTAQLGSCPTQRAGTEAGGGFGDRAVILRLLARIVGRHARRRVRPTGPRQRGPEGVVSENAGWPEPYTINPRVPRKHQAAVIWAVDAEDCPPRSAALTPCLRRRRDSRAALFKPSAQRGNLFHAQNALEVEYLRQVGLDGDCLCEPRSRGALLREPLVPFSGFVQHLVQHVHRLSEALAPEHFDQLARPRSSAVFQPSARLDAEAFNQLALLRA